MYRIVHCRMWRRGGSFRKLSGPTTPNAQHLWLYLLTGDSTIAIPGVIPVTREGLASRLDWKADRKFDRCVAEIAAAKMAVFDWSAGLVWCPGAFTYNKPQSPNVVRSWGKAFDLLSECAMKVEIWKAISAYCTGLGEPFARAFAEGFPQAFAVSLLFPDPDPAPAPAKASSKRKVAAAAGDEFDRFWQAYPRKLGKQTAMRAWERAINERRIVSAAGDPLAAGATFITVAALIQHVTERAASDRQWLKDDGEFIPHPATFLNQSRWTDSWKPVKGKQAGAHVEDATWEYDTYRKADSKQHHDHPQWLIYVQAAADLPPRTAPPFEEWLKKHGGAGCR